MKKILFLLFALPLWGWGQTAYQYSVDLQDVSRDRVHVEVAVSRPEAGKLVFQFPRTVPGTYAVLDYGRFVKGLKAYDADGERLDVDYLEPNRFVVAEGNKLAKISYDFQDTWEHGGKPKIFEPAGCGFEAGKYFGINGGMFGFLEGDEEEAFELSFSMPAGFKGYSSLPSAIEGQVQTFTASSYHAVIDHPILFTPQEAKTLQVAGTEVQIATYYEGNDASAEVSATLAESMEAIEQFVGETPVDRYAYLIYFDGQEKMGKAMAKAGRKGKVTLGMILKALPLINQGYGALEHGTSSFYFMPAFDDESYSVGMEEVAIHEFMHIYAPLSLHSQFVGDFDYVDPIMSQHLWLYEGCTEYFAGLIQQQGDLVSLSQSLNSNWSGKIRAASRYPDSIPFTVMSANVFDEPYESLYGHVYDRGAIMAMLLDFEIMALTDGEKTLKDVIFTLSERYGATESFDEDTFFETFVAEVHPDLMDFFDRYVKGKEPLDLEGGFEKVGIRYYDTRTGDLPVNLLGRDNGVRSLAFLPEMMGKAIVGKVEEGDVVGFQQGDVIPDPWAVNDVFFDETGHLKLEGSEASLTVIREGVPVELSFRLPFKSGSRRYYMEPMDEDKMSEQQAKLFQLWVEGR